MKKLQMKIRYKNKYTNILSVLFDELEVIETADGMLTLAVSEADLELLLERLRERGSLFAGPDADHCIYLLFPKEMGREMFAAREVVIARYGVENEDGYLLGHAGALRLFEQLRVQEMMPDCSFTGVRIEGDAQRGAIYATWR